MRIALLTLFSLVSFVLCNAQTYNVVHVKGEIYNFSQQKNVLVGDQVSGQDEIEFKTDIASCFLLNLPKGRYLLKPGGSNHSVLSQSLTPVPKRSTISTRADVDSTIINLFDYFGSGKYLFLNQIDTLLLSEYYFPLSGEKHIVARYNTDSKIVTKRLKNIGQELILDPSTLYGHFDNIELSVLANTTQLYLYDTDSKEFKKLAEFYPTFVGNDQLTREIEVIVNSFVYKDFNELMNEIASFIEEIYGQFSEKALKNWLNQNIKLQ